MTFEIPEGIRDTLAERLIDAPTAEEMEQAEKTRQAERRTRHVRVVRDRLVVLCVFCGAELDPDAATTYQKVIGWEHPRVAGGTNAVALRQPVDEFACSVCIGRLRRGTAIEQMTIEGGS